MRPFIISLDKARLTPGIEIDLLTFAMERGYVGKEQELNEALSTFISGLLPDGRDRKTLEAEFNNNNSKISEWQTKSDSVIIGLKTKTNKEGESTKSWYLRNTSKKHSKILDSFRGFFSPRKG
jgi:hypothetical protein